MTRLRSLQYLGGKNGKRHGFSIGDWVASHLPTRSVYVEPFAGMLGVLLARKAARNEIVNDADSLIVNWWAAVRDDPERLEHLVRHSPSSEADFHLAVKLLREPFEYTGKPDMERAVAVFRQLSFSIRHTLDPPDKTPGYAVGWTPAHWKLVRPTIHRLAKRLESVQFLCRDALSVMERVADQEDLVCYCDPPYPDTTSTYGATVDFDRMAEVLASMKGAVAVSGFNDDWDRLGWRKEEVERPFLAFGKADEVSSRREVLWMNYDAPPSLFA